MTCASVFSISDGLLVVEVSAGAVSEAFEIGREVIDEGLDYFRAADGSGTLYVRFEAIRYSISGAGPADPGLWALDLTAASWTVTIPGFADGSADEIWTVLPARPRPHSRDRRGVGHRWALILESA